MRKKKNSDVDSGIFNFAHISHVEKSKITIDGKNLKKGDVLSNCFFLSLSLFSSSSHGEFNAGGVNYWQYYSITVTMWALIRFYLKALTNNTTT